MTTIHVNSSIQQSFQDLLKNMISSNFDVRLESLFNAIQEINDLSDYPRNYVKQSCLIFIRGWGFDCNNLSYKY